MDAAANPTFTVLQATNHQNVTRGILHSGKDPNPESRTGNRPGATEDPAGILSVPPLQGWLLYLHLLQVQIVSTVCENRPNHPLNVITGVDEEFLSCLGLYAGGQGKFL